MVTASRNWTKVYRDFIRQEVEFESLARSMKLNVEREALGSDVNRLTSLFVEICENNRDRRDYTRAEIRRALREIGVLFRYLQNVCRSITRAGYQ